MIYSFRFLMHSTRLNGSRSLASKSVGGAYFTRIGAGGKKAAIEAVSPDAEFYADKPEYPPITVPFGSTDTEAMKAERKEYADFVQSLPTVQEKIFAVNPYERPWTRLEGRWHRDYMHPQWEPRTIFRVHAVPEHYNLLSFYQFITKTHCIDGLPSSFHDEVSVDKAVEEFTPLALELIHNEQRSWDQRRFSSTEYAYNVVDQLVNAANALFSPNFPHVADAQISRRSSLQAVWTRGGFSSLYPDDDKKPVKFLDPEWGTEILGDDRSKLGELPFCLREKLSLSVRNRSPLPEIVPLDDPLCRTPVAPFVYAPLTLGVFPEKDGPTYLTPGYEYGDVFEFNSLLFHPIDSIANLVARYKEADPSGSYTDSVRSAGVALSFATLLGQAHYLGFTQYNDLTYPLTTQVILTDGQFWHFCVYQLNSISLINDWEEQDLPTNLAWFSGPLKLYDSVASSGQFQGVNRDVFSSLLKFFLLQPRERPNVELRPYLINKNTADENELKSAQTQARALTSLVEGADS